MGDERSEKPTNGWRTGRDPVQRWLRIVTTVVVLGVFVYLAVNQTDPASRGTEVLVTAALALGSVLLLLGYEGVVKLPLIGREDANSRKDKEDA